MKKILKTGCDSSATRSKKDLKNKIMSVLGEFLESELEEIRNNKFRFALIVFFSFIAIFFVIFDDDEKQVDLINNSVQIENVEQEKNISADKNKNSTNKVVTVKRDKNKSSEKNITTVAVIGANSDELVIRDPFASDENFEDISKHEIEKSSTIPRQVPLMPEKISMPLDLMPIPQIEISAPVQQNSVSQESDNVFFLIGTAISGDNKNAIVKKISGTNEKNDSEEDIIVGVGDYVQGHKIIDITGNSLIFDDGSQPMYMRGFSISKTDLVDDDDTSTEKELYSSSDSYENISTPDKNLLYDEITDSDNVENNEIPLDNEKTTLEENFLNPKTTENNVSENENIQDITLNLDSEPVINRDISEIIKVLDDNSVYDGENSLFPKNIYNETLKDQ